VTAYHPPGPLVKVVVTLRAAVGAGGTGMSLFETWPHNWFGIWKAAESDPFEVPVFSEVVDETWRPHDLDRLVEYLRACPVSITSSMRPARCTLCDYFLPEPSAQRSDGVWVWPSSLSHYVAEHHVRLPDRIVEHIRERGYGVPNLASTAG
jgi:hypothetical protein